MIWFRIFLKILGIILLPVIFWGFICPAMVSVQSDLLVMFGFFIAWMVVPAMLAMIFWVLLEIPTIGDWWKNYMGKFLRRKQ
jgi:hypothetical protein